MNRSGRVSAHLFAAEELHDDLDVDDFEIEDPRGTPLDLLLAAEAFTGNAFRMLRGGATPHLAAWHQRRTQEMIEVKQEQADAYLRARIELACIHRRVRHAKRFEKLDRWWARHDAERAERERVRATFVMPSSPPPDRPPQHRYVSLSQLRRRARQAKRCQKKPPQTSPA